MSEPHPGRATVVNGAIFFFVLLIGYFASYYAIVGVYAPPGQPSMALYFLQKEQVLLKVGHYERNQAIHNFLTPIFFPAHFLDRRLRQDAWKESSQAGKVFSFSVGVER